MDADGCLWICIDPDCPELCAGKLVRLIDYYEDTIEELPAQCAADAEECLAGIDSELPGLLTTEEL
jgi:hypothetical protein